MNKIKKYKKLIMGCFDDKESRKPNFNISGEIPGSQDATNIVSSPNSSNQDGKKIIDEKLSKNSSNDNNLNKTNTDDHKEEKPQNDNKEVGKEKEKEKEEEKNVEEKIEKETNQEIIKSETKMYTNDPNHESPGKDEPKNTGRAPVVQESISQIDNKLHNSSNKSKQNSQNVEIVESQPYTYIVNENNKEIRNSNKEEKDIIKEDININNEDININNEDININNADININNKEDININKEEQIHIKDSDNKNNNYDKFEENKEYYLICPQCEKNILALNSIIYEPDQKDFKITYNCFCGENSRKFLHEIISEKPCYCGEHKDVLNFLCESCKIPLCKECLENHKEHNIKNILNEEVIPEEIAEKINEKKEEFPGNKIIQKIIELYKSEKNSEIINAHNRRTHFISHPETGGSLIIQKTNINVNTDIVGSENINVNSNFIHNFNNSDVNNKSNSNSNININNSNNNNKFNYKTSHFFNEEEKIIEEKDLYLNKYINIKTIKAHEERISALIELNNGFIASGSYDGKVKIWDILKEGEDSLIMIKNSVTAVFCFLEFEPGKLLGGTSLNTIFLWDLNDKNKEEFIFNFQKHDLWVTSLVKLDENHFASASNDTKIIIWDYKNKKYEKVLEGHTDCIMAMILLKNGYLCTASYDENIMIWDWKNSRSLYRFKPHKKYVKCLLELDNDYLLTGSEDNSIGIFKKTDSQQYKSITYLEGHTYPVRSLCQIDENYFASGSFDNKIKIWDFNKKECVQTLEGHQSNVICIIKYKDDMLISCSNDKTIKIWKTD